MRPIASLLIPFTVFTAPVLAQSDPIDADPGNKQQVEDALSVLPRVGTNQTPVMPTQTPQSLPNQPGLTEGQDWLQVLNDTLETQLGASTLAEGSFVLGRVGDLIRTPGDQLVFVPDREQREPGEGAVLLLPCRTLGQLQSEWSGQRVLLSGEIFTYHNRNHLLISDYRLVRDDAPVQDAQDSQPQTDPQQPAEPIEADPQVQDLLRELDRDRPSPRTGPSEPLDNQTQTLPRQPVQTPTTVSIGPPEGTLLLRRSARLVRNARGAWTIVFDNNGPETNETTPLTVLPCRALMKMEQWAMQQGDAARFTVSGRVYSYEGEPYLLPTLVQRLGPSDINSIQ